MSDKRKHTLQYLLVLMICLSLLPSCGSKNDTPIGVAYVVDAPVYAQEGNLLLLHNGAEIVARTTNGGKVSLGEASSVTYHEGIFFCESAEGNTAHFALNGADSGVWVDDALFYDGYAGLGIVEAPKDATLFPQTVNEDAALSYVPERMGYVNRQRAWALLPQYLHDDYEQEQFTDGVALPLDWESGDRLFLTEDGASAPICVSGTISNLNKFRDGLLRVERKFSSADNSTETVLYQFLTKDNQLLQQGRFYGNARDFSERLAAVQKDGLWGFIDTNGNTVIEFQYAVAGDFHEGRAAVSDQQGNIFYIDKTGTRISPLVAGYEFTGEAQGGFFKVNLSSEGSALVDENGAIVSKHPADYYYSNSDNVWYALLDNSIGAEVIVLPNGVNLYSDYYFRFYGNVCIGKTDEKNVLYSVKSGEVLQTAPSIRHFQEGLAFCHDGLRCGYINKEGQWVISSSSLRSVNTKYALSEEIGFHGGLALAHYGGETVMLYNPLIYTNGWISDEFDRALSLGLGSVSMGEGTLTSEQLLALVEDFQNFVRGHLEDGVFLNTPTFRSPAEYLAEANVEEVNREELAVCLCRLAEDLGKPTKHYMGFYADQDSITYPSEVNYIASIALFDIEGNTFDPQGGISQRDAVILFLRFTEAML